MGESIVPFTGPARQKANGKPAKRMVLFASSAVYFPGLGIRRNTDAHIVFVTGIQFDGTAYHAA
jgi:hypothetical protein